MLQNPYRVPAPRAVARPHSRAARLLTALGATLAIGAVVSSNAACGQPVTPADVTKIALDVAQYGCIIANADLPNVPAIETACQLDQTLAPAIQAVLSDFGTAAAKRAASAMATKKCQ